MTPLAKCAWVVNELLTAGERGLTLRQLNERWQKCDMGERIARQTFDRWKGMILDMMGIIIDCDVRGGYRYHIANANELRRGELSRWLLATYATFTTLSHHTALRDRILVEEVPSSHAHLTALLSAMRTGRQVEITYRGFQHKHGFTFPIAPYCLKLHQRRWYVYALSVCEGRTRLYSLDRIEALQTTDEPFALPADFNAKRVFATYFGVVMDESVEVQRIVLRANKYHMHYLRSLPLHPSQREIATTADYADFELTLRPTYDFFMELLHAGDMLELTKPLSVRNMMADWARRLNALYSS